MRLCNGEDCIKFLLLFVLFQMESRSANGCQKVCEQEKGHKAPFIIVGTCEAFQIVKSLAKKQLQIARAVQIQPPEKCEVHSLNSIHSTCSKVECKLFERLQNQIDEIDLRGRHSQSALVEYIDGLLKLYKEHEQEQLKDKVQSTSPTEKEKQRLA